MPGIKDWLRKSASDLKLAKKAIGDDETIDPAVYLAHQCAEKSLKTYFIFDGKTIPKTHDLNMLLEGCVGLDLEFLLLKNDCRALDPYGFSSRYPNDVFFADQTKLIDAIRKAQRIFDFVQNKVLRG